MDGISLALGVLTVIQTAATAAETLYDFAKTVHDAPDEVKSLTREANSLYGVLRRIDEALNEPTIVAYVRNNPNIERDLAGLEEPLRQCAKRIGELLVKLEKNTEHTGDGNQRAMKAFRWYIVKDDVISTRSEVAQARDVATFSFSGLNFVQNLRQRAAQQTVEASFEKRTPSASTSVSTLQQQGSDLRRAARDGDKRLVELLLVEGAPVDSRNREGRTGLSLAAEYGYIDIVRLLLDYKATVDARSYEAKEGNSFKRAEGKRTPLHWAAIGGYLPIANLLLDTRANIEARTVN